MSLSSLAEKWVNRLHYPPRQTQPLLCKLLRPFSWMYSLGLILHRGFQYCSSERYVAKDNTVPVVVCVGNLTTGGTGKTPVVIAIAKWLLSQGYRVAVLSRGYGASKHDWDATACSPSSGDEAYLIQQSVPEAIVRVGKNRVSLLNQVTQEYAPDVVLLDDAFQYRRITANLNIVLIDGERLLGSQCLLPVGPLREPLTALERADVVMVTKQFTSSSVETARGWVSRYGKKNTTVLEVPFECQELIHWRSAMAGDERVFFHNTVETEQGVFCVGQQSSVILVSGIANPASFYQSMINLGFFVEQHVEFPDHYVYTQNSLEPLRKALMSYSPGHVIMVTTEKDVAKLYPVLPTGWQAHLYVLRIRANLAFSWLAQALQAFGLPSAHTGLSDASS